MWGRCVRNGGGAVKPLLYTCILCVFYLMGSRAMQSNSCLRPLVMFVELFWIVGAVQLYSTTVQTWYDLFSSQLFLSVHKQLFLKTYEGEEWVDAGNGQITSSFCVVAIFGTIVYVHSLLQSTADSIKTNTVWKDEGKFIASEAASGENRARAKKKEN